MGVDFRNFRGIGLNSLLSSELIHSAKGSTWNDHKYIKRIDGTYYYPDSYEGGRHLPKGSSDSGDKDDKEKESKNSKDSGGTGLERWERMFYKDVASTLSRNPGLFDVKDLTDDDWQDFELTLAEFGGLDTDSMTKDEIEKLRKKVAEHYSDESNYKNDGSIEVNNGADLAKEVGDKMDEFLKSGHNFFDPEILIFKKGKYENTREGFDGIYETIMGEELWPSDISDDDIKEFFSKLKSRFKEYDTSSSESESKTAEAKEESTESDQLEDWEKVLYKEVDETLTRNPGLFDPRDITDDDWQDFGLTLAEFAGIDADELSPQELERMRAKVADYYSARTLSADDIEKLAKEVIKGNFGNGQARKDALGMNYQQVQDRVNELLKSGSGSTKISSIPPQEVAKATSAVEQIVNAVTKTAASTPSLDMEKIFRVYRNKS